MFYFITCTYELLKLKGVPLFSRELWVYFCEVQQEIMYCFRSNPSVKQGGNEMMSFENGKRTALTIVVNGVKK